MIYVLELEGGKYYVGYTEDPQRIKNHFEGLGALWTRKHKPIKVVEKHEGGSKIMEKEKTLEYMVRYGWENVRGWAWSQCERTKPPECLSVGAKRGSYWAQQEGDEEYRSWKPSSEGRSGASSLDECAHG